MRCGQKTRVASSDSRLRRQRDQTALLPPTALFPFREIGSVAAELHSGRLAPIRSLHRRHFVLVAETFGRASNRINLPSRPKGCKVATSQRTPRGPRGLNCFSCNLFGSCHSGRQRCDVDLEAFSHFLSLRLPSPWIVQRARPTKNVNAKCPGCAQGTFLEALPRRCQPHQ